MNDTIELPVNLQNSKKAHKKEGEEKRKKKRKHKKGDKNLNESSRVDSSEYGQSSLSSAVNQPPTRDYNSKTSDTKSNPQGAAIKHE